MDHDLVHSMNRKGFARIVMVVLAGFQLLNLSCGREDGGGTAGRMSAEVVQALAPTGQRRVDLAEVAPFEWDTVWFFGPYTPVARIEKVLGHPWRDAASYRMQWRDDVVLVVFSRGSRVVRAMTYPRIQGDLAALSGQKLLRSAAVLTVQPAKAGSPKLAAAAP